jgi:hypothetical protein
MILINMLPLSSYTVYREFGSAKRITFLSNYLKDKRYRFQNYHEKSSYSDKELFEEMGVWIKIGHQPSKDEWNSADYKISYDTYPRHFDSWQNACLKFIEYKSGHAILAEPDEIPSKNKKTEENEYRANAGEQKNRRTRTISLSVRVKVLARDKFKCVFCGKSPATDVGTQLHIDHIAPFSRGGQNTLENLQTLCLECNLGKSNLESI